MFSRKMKLTNASKFCYRFGTGLKAGADLMKLLSSEASHGPEVQRQAMAKVAAGAKRGELLSTMMAQDKFFPPLMTAMIRVGEETGKLEHTLLTLSEHYQQQLATRRAFISSVAWPSLQLFAGVGVISLLILIMGMFDMADVLGFGLRGVSGVLWLWFYLLLFCVAPLALMIWAFFRNVGGVQNLIPLVYKIPFIGPAIQTITISRFCWTLSLSLAAGLDPIRSIKLSLESTNSDYYRAAADDAEDAIRRGATLAGTLEATNLFPDDFLQRIEIAEHSGTDAESIDYMTKEYDERARRAIAVIAGVATIVIRVTVMIVLIVLIFRIFKTAYMDPINEALNDPILPRRGN